jgi:type I restriction enzyme R subunit
LLHDRTGQGAQVEQQLTLDQFPSPDELWRRYCTWKSLTPATEAIVTQAYHTDGGDRTPYYYQVTAINRVIEAAAKGQKRILLVMATGTGKTYTAFQIIWRLWKAGVKKRILFLADRNILVDQTMTNDFRPFKGAMAKLSTRSKKHRERDHPTPRDRDRPRHRREDQTGQQVLRDLPRAVPGHFWNGGVG